MNPTQESVVVMVSQALDARPIRWGTNVGDHDGRGRMLEVFNADAACQRVLLRQLRPHRDALEAAAGGSVVIVFHTRAESERLYADFLRGWSRPMVANAPELANDVWLPELTQPPRKAV